MRRLVPPGPSSESEDERRSPCAELRKLVGGWKSPLAGSYDLLLVRQTSEDEMPTFPPDCMQQISKEIIAFFEMERWGKHYGKSLSVHFERWTGNDLTKDHALIEGLCKYIAIEYNNKRMSFYDCDVIVNVLWEYESSFMTERITPPILWRVYEAFDAGEWHRKPDKSDDPIAERTDPAIAAIVASL